MLDIRLVREKPGIVKRDLEKRGEKGKIKILDSLLKEDGEYRKILREMESLKHQRNIKTDVIAKRKREGEKNIEKYTSEMKRISSKIKSIEERVVLKRELINSLLFQLPNLLHESVPTGRSEEENKELRKWGKIPSFAFPPKGHEEVGLGLDILDLERAAKISGARFFFLKNQGVLLDYALQRYAIDFLLKKGFSIISPPMIMRREAYEGVVALEDFEDVMYKLEGEDLYLIATSEHPLITKFMGETLDQETLPMRLAGTSTNFRKEAGSHGKDTKGIFRVHQFNKIEQIIISKPEDSWRFHEELMKNTESLFRGLELPYRIVNVCTGDIGSIAAKKYDLEVWMPVQKKYREAASCSNATDYQARRLRIKYGKRDAPATGLVHTINNTAIATSRAIVAILENYQKKDGSVLIPRVLRPYMGGMKKIENV
jgi:seryl-tRNA synthetase